jgi:hypothetical protein
MELGNKEGKSRKPKTFDFSQGLLLISKTDIVVSTNCEVVIAFLQAKIIR